MPMLRYTKHEVSLLVFETFADRTIAGVGPHLIRRIDILEIECREVVGYHGIDQFTGRGVHLVVVRIRVIGDVQRSSQFVRNVSLFAVDPLPA